jgi:hypothetical protein
MVAQKFELLGIARFECFLAEYIEHLVAEELEQLVESKR